MAPTKTVIMSEQHGISPKQINPRAVQIIQRLQEAGFEAYVVGGGVRDLLLHQRPKDFDIATSAHPNEIRKLFRNCRLIGKRFRLAHIYFSSEIIEVATFRAGHAGAKIDEAHTRDGMIVRDNVYGTLEEDAWRRDFSINALYYDPIENIILDFINGFHDLQQKILRVLGNAEERYREDPVRMLRAARFLGKLNFIPTADTEDAIFKCDELLARISPARLFEEVLKLSRSGAISTIFPKLEEYRLLQYILPVLHEAFQNRQRLSYFQQLLKNTDERIRHKKTTAPHFLFAALLWYAAIKQADQYKKMSRVQAFQKAAKHVLHEQAKHTTLPNRISLLVREMWLLQHRLVQRRPKSIFRILEHPRFRAAYDLLLLRAETEEKDLKEITAFWTNIQTADHATQKMMIEGLSIVGRQR